MTTPPASPDRPGPTEVTVTVKPWGPYVVQGPVTLVDPQGAVITPPPAKTPGVIKLCSCGHSRTRPFCDGSHKTCSPPEPPAALP